MALTEVLIAKVGGAVAKTLLRLWIRDDAAAAGVSAGTDVLASRLPDLLARRRLQRQLDQVAETVAKKLAPHFEVEYGGLPPNEQEAAALAVADTLTADEVSLEDLLEDDLDPLRLEERLRAAYPDASALLNEAGTALYDFALREVCNYLVEIAVTLPPFTTAATRELLERESELIVLVERVLEKLPDPHGGSNESQAQKFEVQYRREIARRLDRLELFGVTASSLSTRYALSVAYITLTASQVLDSGQNDSKEVPDKKGHPGPRKDEDDAYVRVDEALSTASRALVRGEAGSGKTTLLRWLAVQSARQSFAGPLEEWNDTVPFFIQLRRYVGSDLPAPEQFLDHTAKPLAGSLPNNWVHEQLDSGRALVLIDGVDELPEEDRAGARDWLDALTGTFPEARYIVTTRPPAVAEDWLESEGYRTTELQPMTFSDVLAFIEHWHQATGGEISDPEELEELQRQQHKLIAALRDSAPLRILAASPLLCAMLCALNRDRRSQLPRDRLDLYRIGLEMLLERRDVEREVLEPDVRLTLQEKQILLQDLAYWLLRNNQSDVETDAALERITRKLAAMPHVTAPADVLFRHLLVRSGLLREPTEGRVDFIHRTFQEYLGAKEAVEAGDIGLLLERASQDQWREVIVLAAGHARLDQRAALITGLLERGDEEPQHRHRLHLLAVACLETSPELPPDLHTRLRGALSELVPPTSMTEARALASAGDLAVPLLAGHVDKPVNIASACIRTLSLIGGDKALEIIASHGGDTRKTVTRELVRAWEAFDPIEYAERVLGDTPLPAGQLTISSAQLLEGLPHLRHLRQLTYVSKSRSSSRLDDVGPVAALVQLESLSIRDATEIDDIRPLASLKQLRNLDLAGASSVTDFSPLSDLTNLNRLVLDGTQIEDLAQLQGLSDLQVLELAFCDELRDIGPLSGLRELVTLDLQGIDGLTNISGLEKLDSLSTLHLSRTSVADLSPIAHHRTLEFLSCDRTPVADLEPVRSLSNLFSLSCGDTQIADLEPLADCRELLRLTLSGCDRVAVFEPLGALDHLRYLSLSYCPQFRGCGALTGLDSLQEIVLAGCRDLADVDDLASLQRLRRINLQGCIALSDITPLAQLEELRVLDLRGCSEDLELGELRRPGLRILPPGRRVSRVVVRPVELP